MNAWYLDPKTFNLFVNPAVITRVEATPDGQVTVGVGGADAASATWTISRSGNSVLITIKA
jgi:hypothetical protein